jgi:acyl carrier protein
VTAAPGRAEIIGMLATYGDRRPEDVGEGIDSLELAWLVHQLEQHYGDAVLDLSDDELARMSTVDGAVEVLAGLSGAPVTP